MNAFNKSYNSKLVALTPIPTVPASIFSETHSSLDEISDGMKIAVPQDEGNMARAFVMLQDIGWIKLRKEQITPQQVRRILLRTHTTLNFLILRQI